MNFLELKSKSGQRPLSFSFSLAAHDIFLNISNKSNLSEPKKWGLYGCSVKDRPWSLARSLLFTFLSQNVMAKNRFLLGLEFGRYFPAKCTHAGKV